MTLNFSNRFSAEKVSVAPQKKVENLCRSTKKKLKIFEIRVKTVVWKQARVQFNSSQKLKNPFRISMSDINVVLE